MPNKGYSVVERLRGAVLGRLKGEAAAASELRTDKRTIRRWLAAAPEDGWTLARDLAQARLHEHLATGKVAPSQLATIAGIAERNVRYAELLRQREARRQGEAEQEAEPTPLQAAIDTLSDEAKRWLRDYIEALIHRVQVRTHLGRAEPQASEASDEYLAFLRELAESTEEQRQAWMDGVFADVAELTQDWHIVRQGYLHQIIDADGGEYGLFGSRLDPIFEHLPVKSAPTRPPEPAPPPAETAQEPQPRVELHPEPPAGLMVLPAGDHPGHDGDHPTWRRTDW